MANLITKLRRGLTTEWLDTAIIPEEGELIIETCVCCTQDENCKTAQDQNPNTSMCPNCGLHKDLSLAGTKRIKIGNGINYFNELPYIDDIVFTDLSSLESQLAQHIALTPSANPSELEEEIVNGRVGYNGIVYENIGESIRTLGRELKGLRTSLADFIDAQAVDGLHYEGNKLYLTASGVILEDSEVTIVSGGGDGPGGSGGAGTTLVLNNENKTTFITAVENQNVDIKFSFISTATGSDGQPYSTGSGSYKVLVNGVARASGSIEQETVKSINVAPWLMSDENTIEVQVTDSQGASRKLKYTVDLIVLTISDTSFNAAQAFTDQIGYPYKATGNIDKVAHFIMRGYKNVSATELEWAECYHITSPVLTDQEVNTTQLLPYPATYSPTNKFVRNGIYELETYITAEEGGLESTHIIRQLAFWDGTNNADPLLTSVYNVSEISQGELINIPYFIYDANKDSVNDVKFEISYQKYDSQTQQYKKEIFFSDTKDDIQRSQYYWSVQNYPVGEAVSFTISYTDPDKNIEDATTVSVTHTIRINSTEISSKETLDNLELYLSARNRSNDDRDRNTWSYQSGANGPLYTSTLSNFNWQTNGWVNDRYPEKEGDPCLRLNGNARAVINYKPFDNDFKTTGKTLELEFAIRNVNDRDAVAFSCYDETSKIGFYATADKFVFSGGGAALSCQYKEEERIRITITVEKQATNEFYSDQFVRLYLNGVLSGIAKYDGSFLQGSIGSNSSNGTIHPISIGSDLCEVDFYNIRIYQDQLLESEVLDNYIFDLNNFNKKLSEFKINDVWKNNEISYSKLQSAGTLPLIIFVGKLPTKKGDKKKNSVRMILEHPTNPDLNIDEILKEIDVQGTSSAGYPRKNWKIKFNDAKKHMNGDELPAKVMCLKVDYAESTGTHNTQNANLVETFYTETLPVKDKNNIPSSLNHLSPSEVPLIRTTITGYPVGLFYIDTDDWKIIEAPKSELILRSDLKFYSKGNYNYDKGAEDVFGFNDDCDTECWEFKENSDSNSFLTPWPTDHRKYWEARYHPRLDELEEYDEAGNTTQANKVADEMITRFHHMYDWVHSTARGQYVDGKGNTHIQATGLPLDTPYVGIDEVEYTHDTDDYRLAKFRKEFENYFNLHYSLIYYVYTFFALMIDQRAKNLFLTYWRPNAYDKSADVINPETNNYDGRWYPYFYDNDSCYGINNTGHMSYDYYHEDTDKVAAGDVFNGQKSVLWCNFRDAFKKQIQETYSQLRNDQKISADNIINTFITEGSSKWGASLYNKDAWNKYIKIATPETDYCVDDKDNIPDIVDAYLYQVRGDGAQHLKYFVENRIKYCDSKWQAGSFAIGQDAMTVRIYSPSEFSDADIESMTEDQKAIYQAIKESTAVVPPNANISITPYSTMYCKVLYGAQFGDTGDPEKVLKGQTVIFNPGSSTVNDKETYILGASQISKIGDLAPLYPKLIDISQATKLIELKIGDSKTGYCNANLGKVGLSSNKLLKRIDIRNCPNLTNESNGGPLNTSGCTNLQELYLSGTSLSSVKLPDAGHIRVLDYPESLTHLSINNQQYIESFSVGGVDLQTPWDEDNIPENIHITHLTLMDTNLEQSVILDNLLKTNYLQAIRLNNFEKEFTSIKDEEGNTIKTGGTLAIEYFSQFANKNGIDANDVEISGKVYLLGKIIVDELTGTQYKEIQDIVPYLDIEFNKLISYVTFVREGEPDHIEEVINSIDAQYNPKGVTCDDPVLAGRISTPTKTPTAQYFYTHSGWSEIEGASVPDSDALNYILGNRTLYPTFNETVQTYDVTFYTENTRIYTQTVPYGTYLSYDPQYALQAVHDNNVINEEGIPLKQNVSEDSRHLYIFETFIPSLDPTVGITGTTNLYATFKFNNEGVKSAFISEFEYTPNHATKTLSLTKYIAVPNNYSDVDEDEDPEFDNDAMLIIDSTYRVPDQNGVPQDYTVTSIGGFTVDQNPEELENPTVVDVEYIILPDTLTTINSNCFKNCKKIFELTIPENVTKIGKNIVQDCKSLNTINYNAKQASLVSLGINDTPMATMSGNAGININIGAEVKQIPAYMFASNESVVNSITFDPNCKCEKIGTWAFYKNTPRKVELPNIIKNIDSYAFAYSAIETASCDDESEFKLPSTNVTLSTEIFKASPNLKVLKFYGIDDLTGAVAPYCNKLESITLENNGNYYSANNAIIYYNPANKTRKLLQACKTTTLTHDADTSITEISYCAYQGHPIVINDLTIETPYLPNTLTMIGQQAFQECTEIRSIKIPAKCANIMSQAFKACTNLETIIFEEGSSLTCIYNNVFQDCTSINNVDIPLGVTSLEAHCFRGCSNLSTMNLTDNLTVIGIHALRETAFSEFICPDSVREVREYAFQGCHNLTSFTFGESIAEIGNDKDEKDSSKITHRVFNECYNLTTIKCPFGKNDPRAEFAPWGAPSRVTVTFNCNSDNKEDVIYNI